MKLQTRQRRLPSGFVQLIDKTGGIFLNRRGGQPLLARKAHHQRGQQCFGHDRGAGQGDLGHEIGQVGAGETITGDARAIDRQLSELSVHAVEFAVIAQKVAGDLDLAVMRGQGDVLRQRAACKGHATQRRRCCTG